MAKFNSSNVHRFSYNYDGISEPLKEYKVGLDGSLMECSTSESLLGVEINGKWGWIDTFGHLIIPALYDSGYPLSCYNGIIVLCKNGNYGGLYRDTLSEAFSFKYSMLSHAYRDTYVAWNNSDRCALIKPGDILMTSYKYKGFSICNHGNITEYIRPGFLGLEKHGNINLETGRELS